MNDPVVFTSLDLETVTAVFGFAWEDWQCLGSEQRERIAKDLLLRGLAEQIAPFVEFTVLESKPPRFNVKVVASVRVLRSENGGIIRYERDLRNKP